MKAIYVDLVTDLKSESFMATLKRFFSLREKSFTIMTGNGSNFVRTYNELKKSHVIVNNLNDILTSYLSTEAIN